MRNFSLALVGSESLLGKEVRDALRGRKLDLNLRFIGADDEETGKLTGEGDEVTVITSLDRTNLAMSDVVLLAGSNQSSRTAWDLLIADRDTAVVDIAGALEELPSARLRAPLVEAQPLIPPGSPAVVAHPAAIALALFFRQLEGFTVKQSLAEVFEPASELGQKGIDELHKQTIRLFSFQSLPKDVFDTQLAYAMLASFGLEAPQKLDQVEMKIERHLASLLSSREAKIPMPSLRLIQAPVFHGYSISVWVQFETPTTADALLAAMAADAVDIRSTAEEAPNNVAAAGQNGISIGGIRPDRNRPNAFWFWIAADNLRLSAENAALLVEQLCAG